MRRGLEVGAALRRDGGLLLAEAAASAGGARLLVAGRDSTAPPTGTATGSLLGAAGLRETVAQLDMLLSGVY